MDYKKILNRAWHILWQYRALWVFGFILALTTASYGSNNLNFNLSSTDFYRTPSGDSLPEDYKFSEEINEAFEDFARFITEEMPDRIADSWITIVVVLGILILLLITVSLIFRYLSETALIKMVDEYEKIKRVHTVGYGFRIGWSRTSWRLFLIDLIIGLPLFLFFLLFLFLVLIPLMLWGFRTFLVGMLGTFIAIGFIFLLIIIAAVVSIALGLLKPIFRRTCALEGLGAIESIREGYVVVKKNIKDIGIMWLILLGIKIGWLILMIPVGWLVLILGVIVGGGAALIIWFFAGQLLGAAHPWILAIAVGLPIFLVVVVLPTTFLNGLYETFFSTVWTLTYREVTLPKGIEMKKTS